MTPDLPVPPQNRDAERGVLGGVLRDPDVLPAVRQHLAADDFYFDAHQRVFRALCELAADAQPIDLVLLYDRLRRNGHLEDAGGKDYLVELWESVPTGANAEHHARLVKDTARLRGVIHACNELLRDAYSPTMSAAELVSAAARKLLALDDGGGMPNPQRVGDLAREEVNALDERIGSGSELSGLSTGYPDLDQYTGGLEPGELVVLGARPSLGKTALSLNIAERVARAGSPALFFSLEMPGRQIALRTLAMKTGVSMHRIARPKRLSPDDITALFEAVGAGGSVGALPLHVLSGSDWGAARIAAAAARAVTRLGVKLVVVDYLGLMRPENPRDNRAQQVGLAALRMKRMAMDLGLPVVLLAQLNRDLEHTSRKPRLSDLRESGEIEQHADRVLLLHRESDLDLDAAEWPVELIVAKNRNGPIGEVPLTFCRPVVRFENKVA